MKRKSAATKKKTSVGSDYRVVHALLDFLRRGGLSKPEISTLISSVLNNMKNFPKNKISKLSQDSTIASAVGIAFHRWYRDRSLLDAKGMPKPLKLLGVAPSVEALIRRERPAQSSAAIAQELRSLKILKKAGEGRYIPTGMHTLIRFQHPYLYEYLAHSVVRLLTTAQENAYSHDPSKALFERYAHVPLLPKSKLRAFREFTSQQGEALIDTTNDWLESHRVKRPTRNTPRSLQAGLHVFAYVGPARATGR